MGTSPSAAAESTSRSGPAGVPGMTSPAGRGNLRNRNSEPVSLSHNSRCSAVASPSIGMTDLYPSRTLSAARRGT
jgi:hypothetical protein